MIKSDPTINWNRTKIDSLLSCILLINFLVTREHIYPSIIHVCDYLVIQIFEAVQSNASTSEVVRSNGQMMQYILIKHEPCV